MIAVLRRWRALVNHLAGREDWKSIDDDVPPSFFQYFRPAGIRLAEAFQGVTCGQEILERLMEVFRVAGDGRQPLGEDAYFIVRNPATVKRTDLILLVNRHLANLARMAEALGGASYEWAGELRPLREGRFLVEALEGSPPERPADVCHPLESAFYELTGDFVRSLDAQESDALLLQDALYHIACSYNLARHVLWPLYRKSSRVEEPFGASFDLWKLGAELRFEGDARCLVYVPRLLQESG